MLWSTPVSGQWSGDGKIEIGVEAGIGIVVEQPLAPGLWPLADGSGSAIADCPEGFFPLFELV